LLIVWRCLWLVSFLAAARGAVRWCSGSRARAGCGRSFRATRSAPGSWSAPAAVCVPFDSGALASMWARSVAALGWRVWVRRGRRCPGAPWECKVAVPAGLSASGARALLPPVPRLSSLAPLGVC
jgi:hypothetical protein